MSSKLFLVLGICVLALFLESADARCKGRHCKHHSTHHSKHPSKHNEQDESIGCYKEESSHRALNYHEGNVTSPDECVSKCERWDYKYAGIQDGYVCWCGTKFNKHGKSSGCNKKCESGQMCGGVMANSIYTAGSGELRQAGKDFFTKLVKHVFKHFASSFF